MSTEQPFGGDWSGEKLSALKSYFQSYTTALKNTPFKLAYIDAFAGSGLRKVFKDESPSLLEDRDLSEDEHYRHGSPLIALDIERVFSVMADCPHLTFQVLTKRSDRLAKVASQLNWAPNIWMGVSVENNQVFERVRHLKKVPASVRFLSCEPLIGSLKGIPLSGIDWVIAGGESGSRPRPMEQQWATELRDKCFKQDVPFFFKQWGGRNKKAAGRKLEGSLHDELPKPKKRRQLT